MPTIATYGYDNNGNLISKTSGTTVWSYAYDYENRLVSATKQKNSITVLTLTFKYDPFGRRIEKKVTDNSGAQPVVKTYSYVYDNEDIVLEYLSTDEGGTITTSTAYYVHGPGIDEPLSIEKDGTSYYYVSDTQGSVTAVLDTNQTLTEVFQYKTFGQTTKVSQLIGNTFAYTGRQWDDETGLYYYRARYYDPNAGRFISKDPIGFNAGDETLYVYVGNNPSTWVDPWGLKICRKNLPGIGQTYLDDAFSPLVTRWITANADSGINVVFTEAFRTSANQRALANNPNAITPAPAGNSLHEAGFAVDISWAQLNSQQRNVVVQNAINSGLSWGGNFSHPDPVHFYNDPGNRVEKIRQAQEEFQEGVDCDCP